MKEWVYDNVVQGVSERSKLVPCNDYNYRYIHISIGLLDLCWV